MEGTKYETVEEYISSFPADIQDILKELHATIKKAAPKAEEVISYNMPAFKQHKVLVYYAANKEHIGFYPTPNPIIAFKEELAKYKTSKGAIQFPIDKPIPKTLVKKIVQYRLAEDAERAKAKKKK